MILTREQLQVLQHSIGADEYGRGGGYRNFFGTSQSSRDGQVCESLVALGFMGSSGKPVELFGGEHVYGVTEAGKLAIAEQSPKPPKMTRSQSRYQKWIEMDSGQTFREWLGIKNRRKQAARSS